MSSKTKNKREICPITWALSDLIEKVKKKRALEEHACLSARRSAKAITSNKYYRVRNDQANNCANMVCNNYMIIITITLRDECAYMRSQ